jgi:hypothetical protein
VKIRQIKSISKKRLRRDKRTGTIKIMGTIIDEEVRKKINDNVKEMF